MGTLEKLIGKDYSIIGSGRYLKTLEHDSLVVDTKLQRFYWNSKDIFGDALAWLTKVKGYSFRDAKEYLATVAPSFTPIPQTFLEEHEDIVVDPDLVESFFTLGKTHREYWKERRGYTDSTIDMFRLGYTGYWYVIPIFIDGQFVNFQCRTPDKKMKHWYSGIGPLPFNIDLVKHSPWFVLTEGPVDAIMLAQNGIPAMSTNTGAGYFDPKWLGRIAHAERIYIVYDNDEAGYAGVSKISDILGYRAFAYNFSTYRSGYDITNYFLEGGTRSGFLRLLEKESKHGFEVGR